MIFALDPKPYDAWEDGTLAMNEPKARSGKEGV